MKNRSIRFRLTVWYAAILVAALGLFGGLIWFTLRHQLVSEFDRELANRAASFEKFYRAEAAEWRGPQLLDELNEFCQALPAGSAVEFRGDHGFSFRYPDTAAPRDVATRDVRVKFSEDGQQFDLEIRGQSTQILHTLDVLRLQLLALIPIVILLSCAGGAWLSARALRPVRDVTNAALNISIENLSQRLPVPETGDELARLAEVLNGMLGRLESAVRRLSQFAADASHELRTPLAIIATTSELALRRARDGDSYRESLAAVSEQARRMTDLVESLLLLARNDTGSIDMPLAPLDLRSVAEGVLRRIQPLAEARASRIVSDLCPNIAPVRGNAPALERLMIVLLDNALKYSPRGSEVALRVIAGDSEVLLVVEDAGPGIPPEEIPQIFQRFYRADRGDGAHGYGLGLSLAECIARAHGASVEVRARDTGGSIFEVAFPRCATDSFRESSALASTV